MQRRTLGVCDRCGLEHKLRDLKHEVYARKRNGLRVCSDCFDGDHPRNIPYEGRYDDPAPVTDPRPGQDPADVEGAGWYDKEGNYIGPEIG